MPSGPGEDIFNFSRSLLTPNQSLMLGSVGGNDALSITGEIEQISRENESLKAVRGATQNKSQGIALFISPCR